MAISTLRARLTLWYVAVLTCTLIAFTVLLYAALSRALYRHHDAELAAAAEQLQNTLTDVPLDQSAIDRQLATSRNTDPFVMVRDHMGELQYRSSVLQASEPNIGRHEALIHAATDGESAPQFFTTSLERSGTVRFICVPLPTAPAGYLQIGRPLGDVAPTLDTFRDASLIVLPLVIVLTSCGGWLLGGRALAPMKEIDHTLNAIHASDLSSRVKVKATDAELQHLATTVNQTLDRLEAAFSSIREFSADASHQLQTPLAVMKSSLEFAKEERGVPDEALLDQLLTMVDEMSAVLADLQALALADADLTSTRSCRVNLSETCLEALEIVTALAESLDIVVEASIEPAIHVWGDPVRLRQAVLNLGDNAVKYTNPGGRVRLSLTHSDSSAVIQVSDTGTGIESQHLPHIFERFYRADRRAVGAAGTGLGLAIVKRIVEVHRGSIGVASRPGQGSTFTITLPTCSPVERLPPTRNRPSQRSSGRLPQ